MQTIRNKLIDVANILITSSRDFHDYISCSSVQNHELSRVRWRSLLSPETWSKMTTRPVRVEFWCDNQTLKFTHNVPAQLVENVSADASHHNPQYMSTFVSAIKPIISQRYQAAYNATQPMCCICEAPKTQVIVTPMSWLHTSDPFIKVMCCPACNKPECDTRVRQNVQTLMAEMNEKEEPENTADAEASTGGLIGEIMPCRVCQTTENTSRCGKCGTAFYCGREHQKMDWPLHKKACKKVSKAWKGIQE